MGQEVFSNKIRKGNYSLVYKSFHVTYNNNTITKFLKNSTEKIEKELKDYLNKQNRKFRVCPQGTIII